VQPDESVWRTVDLYLDLLVRTGRGVEVLDTDELMAAVRLGVLSAHDAQLALEVAYRAVAGIAAHGYDIQRWLTAEGVELAWGISR
jgi:predicted RNA-binding protein associated with RNAse of E/G family